MKIKRLLAVMQLLAAIMMLAALSACSETDEPQAPEEDEPDTPGAALTEYFQDHYVPEILDTPYYTVAAAELLTPQQMAEALASSPATDAVGGASIISSLVSHTLTENCESTLRRVKQQLNRPDVTIAYLDLKLHYTSTDPCGKDVTLSGRAVVGGYIVEGSFHSLASEILIGMPYTRTQNSTCATEAMPLEVLAGPEALVIVPDILGYGVSADRPTPYIFNESAGRQGYDLTLCAVHYMVTNGLRFSRDLRTYSCGVSQGGGYGLAVHKVMESSGSATGVALRFAGSLTAAGPYSPSVTFRQFSVDRRKEIFGEAAAFPMLYLAVKEYYPEETAGIQPTDVMRQELIDAGILDMVRAKTYSDVEINALVLRTVGAQTFDRMAADDFRPDGNQAYAVMEDIFARESTLLQGWEPKTPIRVMFAEADEFVPFDNYTALYKTFPEHVVRIPISASGHVTTGLQYYRALISHTYR